MPIATYVTVGNLVRFIRNMPLTRPKRRARIQFAILHLTKMTNRSRTSLLTLAAFLLHVVGGCCAHHAHAGAPTDGRTNESVSSTHSWSSSKSHSCCQHEAEQDDQNTKELQEHHDSKPCAHDGRAHQACNEAGCSFDVPARVKLKASHSAATFAVVVEATASAGLSRRLSHAAPYYSAGAHSSNGVRLLLQIWRI